MGDGQSQDDNGIHTEVWWKASVREESWKKPGRKEGRRASSPGGGHSGQPQELIPRCVASQSAGRLSLQAAIV
ncbi:uncharacterized protein AKAW2_30598S [Aspergillus luchuensis]|uniref:Uncharacterized protein n=1 Tax=Aspergillus kawachii TaxID=1069201 RepID=A0A7R7ZXZ1_ASPKA|nr:uncharacterized protein AKAW2_30598S [Aspergillus luchuensis]BCR97279.1 hypothetical protein AKAW2_30598S [Aspergillus luchuensis]BCS09744.1 hypothetical protein ALUC_30561S [Aspergillus luchuensis]GAA88433.1 hypothetical protein AKAW_06547 [Aspergillus luchuensis IFO 4308]